MNLKPIFTSLTLIVFCIDVSESHLTKTARAPHPLQFGGMGRSPELREGVLVKLPRRVNL